MVLSPVGASFDTVNVEATLGHVVNTVFRIGNVDT